MNLRLILGFVFIALVFVQCGNKSDHASHTESTLTAKDRMLLRADSLELDTKYQPPPGTPLHHHTAGYAKILCSAIFITGLDADFATENIGFFSSPYEERSKVSDREIDYNAKTVSLTLPDGVTRVAQYVPGHGCICLAKDEDKLHFTPKIVEPNLPDPLQTAWPMGDQTPNDFPTELDQDQIKQAVDAAFSQTESMTAAYVVTWKGQIIGEKYKDGIEMHTPLESWSMGKSLTATLIGLLIEKGVYSLQQRAPIPEWQEAGDPRADIKISDILRMSSGIRFRAPQDPDFDPSAGYPDHLYVYTSGVNTFKYVANLPQQWPPNTIGRYRNCDPVLTNYLIRLGVEGQGLDYHAFPQRALFDKIGIRNMVIETDPYGNFLLQGYEFGTARDWARLGNLYLQDGMWNDERILPEGFTSFVSTLAPAWRADGRPIYGGFFWINGESGMPIPKEAYFMAGAGLQMTIIIPSHDLVVVRLGHYRGSDPGKEDLNKSLRLLMEAIPPS